MRVAHGQGAPASNVESCGSGFYPLQWGLHDCRRLPLGEGAARSISGYRSAFDEFPPSANRGGKQRGKKFRPGVTGASGIMRAEGVVRLILALIAASVAFAANKPSPTPTVKTGNADVELTATLYVDKASIAQLLGSDLGGYYVVVNVRLAPKNSEKIKVFRDDFQLRTDRDGERSKPFAASQIAGRGALVVSRT